MSRKLLSRKELADQMGRSVRFVQQMTSEGFRMRGARATIEEARDWLDKRGNKLKWKRKR